jgi:fatty acid desaturase
MCPTRDPGLDRQIEHHLFPTLPPARLREIAPEVRAICERHGVAYKTDTWRRRLQKALVPRRAPVALHRRACREQAPRRVTAVQGATLQLLAVPRRPSAR